MTPNYNLIIDLSSNTSYVPMSVYTKKYESLLTRATVENPHPSYQPSDYTYSSSRSTPITSSIIMSVDTAEDKTLLTTAIVVNPQLYSPTDAATSSSLKYTPITSSKYQVYICFALAASFASSSKIPNIT